MPPSRLQLAKRGIISLFGAAEKRVFTRKELGAILSQHRVEWRLPYDMAVEDFIRFLLQNTKLKDIQLQSRTYSFPTRYTWGEVSPYLFAQSLRRGGYLSHAAAMFLHALTDQIPKTIYANFEQSPKPRSDGLSQESIDRAF